MNRTLTTSGNQEERSLRAPTGADATHESSIACIVRQPMSLVGAPKLQRDALVVTTLDDEQGRAVVVSRFGDSEWDLSSLWTLTSARAFERRIVWPEDLPEQLVDDLKATCYVLLRRGRPNYGPASAVTVKAHAVNSFQLMRHLVSLGVRTLKDVVPRQVADFVNSVRKDWTPGYLYSTLQLLDAAWLFRDEHIFPLQVHPFGGKKLDTVVGTDPRLVRQEAALTPVIPPSVSEKLLRRALALIDEAGQLLAQRDNGQLGPAAYKLVGFRDAVLYLVQVTTGMRNSEALGLASGCWRQESRSGITFCWLRTIDVKTKSGEVDYLMPAQLLNALELLQRFAMPHQAELRREVEVISQVLSGQSSSDVELAWLAKVGRAGALQRRSDAEAASRLLFLGQSGRLRSVTGNCQVDVLNNSGSHDALRRLARSAGVDWPITNMQCRRTFAWEAANSRLGVNGPIFIKWQFHHKNLNLSYLYGANPRQDPELYGELYAEFANAKVQVMERWFLSDEPLSGGAGRRIMKIRATPHKNFETLLRATAETVAVRSTGHSWCTSEGACVGGGPYDSHLCADCSNGVIDGSFTSVWQQLHAINLGIGNAVSSGPSAAAHAQRSLAASLKTLKELGVSVPSQECTDRPSS